MNPFLKAQLQQMVMTTTALKQSCEIAAAQDDGVISREERKLLDKINTLTDNYAKELKKLIDKG